MQIVVLDGHTLNPGDNPWDELADLGELTVYDRTPEAQIVERARDAEIVLTNKTPLGAETLARLPRLWFIAVLATGYNVVDTAAARRHGVPVANVPEYGTDSVAEHVFALVLELCHHVALHDRAVKDGAWSGADDFCFWSAPLVELAGKTLGIVGFGRIGRRVGEIGHAFGMTVLAHDVRQVDPPEYPAFAWADLDRVAAEADVVTLHCPQTEETAGMIDAGLLAKMKPTALFINAARGGLVVERDLADALNNGRIAGAAIDVASAEPIPPDNPLLSARNILITPHIAWATLEARRRLMHVTAENIAAFLKGHPVNVVN
ncbi:MAG: D-2-hydroxyacid dehydrogenase [Planctomycetota bacterium]